MSTVFVKYRRTIWWYFAASFRYFTGSIVGLNALTSTDGRGVPRPAMSSSVTSQAA
jgi:hypothetical protein